MERKIELAEFENENEFGCSVNIYCRDNEQILKRKIFSAYEDKGHFLLRTYEKKASFLTTDNREENLKLEVEHDKLIAKTILYERARKYLKECQTNYAIFE